MKFRRFRLTFTTAVIAVISFSTVSLAQTVTTAEWSARVWAAASDGNWTVVDTLLGKVPVGEEQTLVNFRTQLDAFRSHRDAEVVSEISARDNAIEEMNTFMAEGNVVKAMQSAVEAQTLSKNLDDIMFTEDVQAVLVKTQEEIDAQESDGNILTAQTLLYYLRTFYEGHISS